MIKLNEVKEKPYNELFRIDIELGHTKTIINAEYGFRTQYSQTSQKHLKYYYCYINIVNSPYNYILYSNSENFPSEKFKNLEEAKQDLIKNWNRLKKIITSVKI